jgi:murein L,D-transpeptidase YafK
MVLLDENDNLLSRHRVSLGENPEGQKIKQGDKRTPEGIYKIIDKRKDKKYYKEMLISYPNSEDRARAKRLGVNPGGGITIHAQVPMFWNGEGDDYTLSHDWTNGCMAMTNKGINTIWDMVSLGTTVEIRK